VLFEAVIEDAFCICTVYEDSGFAGVALRQDFFAHNYLMVLAYIGIS